MSRGRGGREAAGGGGGGRGIGRKFEERGNRQPASQRSKGNVLTSVTKGICWLGNYNGGNETENGGWRGYVTLAEPCLFCTRSNIAEPTYVVGALSWTASRVTYPLHPPFSDKAPTTYVGSAMFDLVQNKQGSAQQHVHKLALYVSITLHPIQQAGVYSLLFDFFTVLLSIMQPLFQK